MVRQILIAGLATVSVGANAGALGVDGTSIVLGGMVGSNSSYEMLVGTTNTEAQYAGMAYVSAYKSSVGIEYDGANLGGNYVSNRIGVKADSFIPEKPDFFDLFIYHNKTSVAKILDRYGMGIGVGYGFSPDPNMKISVEGELMPYFLSTAWDTEMSLEYGVKLKGEYRIKKQFSVGVHYQHNSGIYNDNSIQLGQNLGASIKVIF